jgi:hypothetical protein
MTGFEHRSDLRRLRLFVRYARSDVEAVRMVEKDLEALHHRTWSERELLRGRSGWDRVLSEIRRCSAMIVAVSPAVLDSEAVATECDYARSLGKTLLPVVVAPVAADRLPQGLAEAELIDYTRGNPDAARRLAGAVSALRPAGPLPRPLPQPPPVPFAYLSGPG